MEAPGLELLGGTADRAERTCQDFCASSQDPIRARPRMH
jgi:hypothetical protein